MLEIGDLTTAYGGITALRSVSLSIPQGAMVALIGQNGAGKTTLLNSVSGLLRPREGDIRFEGRGINRLAAYEVARLGILQVPEGRRILGPLTVEENLELGRLAIGSRGFSEEWTLDRVFSLFPVLKEKRQQLGDTLSGGQQQMLAISRALMGQPRILLLDEPSLGLAPVIVDQVFKALVELNEAGLTILLVEQNARRALKAAQFAYVLEQGRIVLKGTTAELANNEQIIAHYLGTDA